MVLLARSTQDIEDGAYSKDDGATVEEVGHVSSVIS